MNEMLPDWMLRAKVKSEFCNTLQETVVAVDYDAEVVPILDGGNARWVSAGGRTFSEAVGRLPLVEADGKIVFLVKLQGGMDIPMSELGELNEYVQSFDGYPDMTWGLVTTNLQTVPVVVSMLYHPLEGSPEFTDDEAVIYKVEGLWAERNDLPQKAAFISDLGYYTNLAMAVLRVRDFSAQQMKKGDNHQGSWRGCRIKTYNADQLEKSLRTIRLYSPDGKLVDQTDWEDSDCEYIPFLGCPENQLRFQPGDLVEVLCETGCPKPIFDLRIVSQAPITPEGVKAVVMEEGIGPDQTMQGDIYDELAAYRTISTDEYLDWFARSTSLFPLSHDVDFYAIEKLRHKYRQVAEENGYDI